MNVDEENQVNREKRLARIRDQARIFREVFGSWDKPTPHGKIVLDALSANFHMTSGFPPNQLDDHGRTDALQTWRKLGHFDVLAYIRAQLDFKEIDHEHSRISRP